MKKVGERFEYSPPPDWVEFRDGNRWVFQGPQGQELIVSGMFIAPWGSEAIDCPPSVGDALLRDGLEAMRRGVDDPGLQIIKALAPDDGKCTLPTWTVIAETKERDVLFCEALVSAPGATLFVTLEAPHSPEVLAFLWNVLASVQLTTR